jgi:enamine deaminase RidA (YjgF/YER057c/UK114 family)
MSSAVTYVNPPSAPRVIGMYSHVAIAEPGRIAFIAGQVSVDADGNVVAPNDLAAQVPVVFSNLGKILADLGASFADVLEFTTYLVGPDSRAPWFEARGAVYKSLFPDGRYPPNTLLLISGLNKPEMMVEISAIVRLPG